LKKFRPGYPKTLEELIAKAEDPKTGYRSPEKLVALKYSNSVALDLNNPIYLATIDMRLHQTHARRGLGGRNRRKGAEHRGRTYPNFIQRAKVSTVPSFKGGIALPAGCI
jgi:hypothetical protein